MRRFVVLQKKEISMRLKSFLDAKADIDTTARMAKHHCIMLPRMVMLMW